MYLQWIESVLSNETIQINFLISGSEEEEKK